MNSMEEVELKFLNREQPNWPGYNGKLEFRALKHSDARLLIPVLKTDKGNLSTFLGKFHGHKDWNLGSAQGLVGGLLRQDWPTMTWLFLINEHPIGLISTSRADSVDECQLIISVFSKHQGKGFGKAMTQTILKITEEVFGFQKTWWHVDAANIASNQVARSCGFQFFDTYTSESFSKDASGVYHRLVKDRPVGLADGILQGSPIDYWWVAKDPGVLKMIVEKQSQNKN